MRNYWLHRSHPPFLIISPQCRMCQYPFLSALQLFGQSRWNDDIMGLLDLTILDLKISQCSQPVWKRTPPSQRHFGLLPTLRSTFFRVPRLWRTTGNVVKYPYSNLGRPRVFVANHVQYDYLLRLVRHRPHWFLDELADLLLENHFISVNISTICRELEILSEDSIWTEWNKTCLCLPHGWIYPRAARLYRRDLQTRSCAWPEKVPSW